MPPCTEPQAGMEAAYLPAQQQGLPAGAESVLDVASLGSASGESGSAEGRSAGSAAEMATAAGGASETEAAGAAAGAAAAAAAAGAAAEAEAPLLTHVGVGEAGWGCPGAAQQFRSCKWSARAGLVLQLPDHRWLEAANQHAVRAGAQLPAGGRASGGVMEVPVYLFRSWTAQLDAGEQQRAVQGLGRCDWAAHGFQLEAVSSSEGERESVAEPCLPLLTPRQTLRSASPCR